MREVVSVRDLQSTRKRPINSGVLQESISCPILFILFINEVLKMVEGMESVEMLQFNLNKEFNKADSLIRSLKLRINMTKTKVVLFRDPAQKLSHADRNVYRKLNIKGVAPMDQSRSITINNNKHHG